MNPETLDHVALWVSERDLLADVLTSRFGMHVIDRTDAFTLVGPDARRGKLTLFAADGPRHAGALHHIALRVADLASAQAGLDGDLRRTGDGTYELADGLRVRLVDGVTDLDYVALRSPAPEETARAYGLLGFRPARPSERGAPRVEVGGAYVEFHTGPVDASDRPLLNHLAVRVASADAVAAHAGELGLEIADVVDAPNTRAVFVWGPDRVKIEYVEHKPTFSLV